MRSDTLHYCNGVTDPASCCPIVPWHGNEEPIKANCTCWPYPLFDLYLKVRDEWHGDPTLIAWLAEVVKREYAD